MLMRGWVTLGRLRRRIGGPSRQAWTEARKEWIRRHAPGKSFADVGGLYLVNGEMAFIAEQAGATKVTVFDAGDGPLGFDQERERRGSKVGFVQGDLEDGEAIRRLGEHDVVFCTGVIYHSPNPVRHLMNLREITRERLYLGTHTIPEVPGFPGACVYYPALDDRRRRALATAYERPEAVWGIGTPFNERAGLGYGNFWWGLTPSAVRAMLHTAGFDVVREVRVADSPFHMEFEATPSDRPPLLPPVSYYRERGEKWAAGETPFDWVDDSWQAAERAGELPGP